MDLVEQTERMQTYYGLKHDPFGALVDTMVFSGAGGRYETAETIRHLLAYSPQDSILTGPFGSGKRALTSQVIKQLESQWRIAWVDGSALQTPSDLFQEIIGQLGLGLKLSQIESREVPAVANAIAERIREDESFLLVVQYLDQVPAHLLEMLIQFRSKAPSLEERLRQIWLVENEHSIKKWINENDWYVHELLPLTEDDAYQYLKDRFIAAGHVDAFPIDPKDVARLNQLASGLPIELNSIARDYLISSTFQTAEKKRSFPITHVAAGAAALTLVIIAILYQTNDQRLNVAVEPVQQSTSEPLSVVEQKLAEAVAKVEARQGDITDVPVSVADTAAIENRPVTDIAKPVSSDIELEPVSEPKEASPAKPVVQPVAKPVTRSMLQTAPDNHYTLQLIGVRDRSKLDGMLSKFPDDAPVEVVETVYKNAPWFVLIYGQYPDKLAAKKGVAELPKSINVSDPWARSFLSLRKSQ